MKGFAEQTVVMACDALAGLRVHTKDRGLVIFVTEDGSPPPDREPVSPRSPRPTPPPHATVSRRNPNRRR